MMFRQVCMMKLISNSHLFQSSNGVQIKLMFRQVCMMELFQTAAMLDRIFLFCQAPTHFVHRGISGVMMASVSGGILSVTLSGTVGMAQTRVSTSVVSKIVYTCTTALF